MDMMENGCWQRLVSFMSAFPCNDSKSTQDLVTFSGNVEPCVSCCKAGDPLTYFAYLSFSYLFSLKFSLRVSYFVLSFGSLPVT
jgi:hypothetical protein